MKYVYKSWFRLKQILTIHVKMDKLADLKMRLEFYMLEIIHFIAIGEMFNLVFTLSCTSIILRRQLASRFGSRDIEEVWLI